MRWHRLQILMDRLKSDIDDQNYYLSTADGTVLQRQVKSRCDSIKPINVILRMEFFA